MNPILSTSSAASIRHVSLGSVVTENSSLKEVFKRSHEMMSKDAVDQTRQVLPRPPLAKRVAAVNPLVQ